MSSGSGLTGDWERAIRLLSNNPVKKAIDIARNRIGIVGASMVKKGIRDGAPGGKEFAPLSPFTIWMRSNFSTKPLIDHGDLLGSITHELSGNSGVWIGARRGVRTKDGQDVVDIEDVHEYGRTIKVTDKMRRGFAARWKSIDGEGWGIRKETKYIVIPERSFLRATFDRDEFQMMKVQKTAEAMKKVLHLA
jgi:hypothetical protein